MPTSRFLISASQLLMGINWLVEGNFKYKFKIFFNNKPALFFTLIFGVHIIGLLWSQDLEYAITYDLKHKLPTLTLTLIVVTSPALDIKKIRVLLFLFISSILLVSFIGFFTYATKDIPSFRYILPFGSHLYFGLMAIVAAAILPWLIKQITNKKYWFYASFLISAWIIYFLFITRSLSGIVSFAAVVVFILGWLVINHKSLVLKASVVFLFLVSVVLIGGVLLEVYRHAKYYVEYDFEQLDKYTKEGNPYTHNKNNVMRENGHLVYIYVCDEELAEAWSSVSDIDYEGKAKNKHKLRNILLRYMASKGLRKDKEHFKMLTEEDIQNIEKGIPNYLYADWPGVVERIHQTISGVKIYMKTNNPQMSTLAQRIELWRASFEAIKKKPIIGWGTGDIYQAVQYGLEKNNAFYYQGRDVKPHNQYLLFLITFGLLGFIVLVYLYSYTVFKTNAHKILPFSIFLVAFAVNMLGNNPIDSQFGQTIFVFFTLFFCFIYPFGDK